jgi:putative lipoprotein
MVRVLRSLPAVFLLLAISGIVSSSKPSSAALLRSRDVITGTATYRERVALSHGAVFEARLSERPRAGGSGRTLARVVLSNPGQVPIHFEIPVDPRRIERGVPCVIRATITEGSWVRFTGEVPYPPGRGGAPVTILMRAVTGNEPPRRPRGEARHGRARAGLEDIRWAPIRIGDRAVFATRREPWMELDSRTHRMNGSGGCNRMSGGYEADDARLRFGPIASTKMACVDMKTEQAFFRTLERTRRYRVSGRRLELLDQGGSLLASLEERNLR